MYGVIFGGTNDVLNRTRTQSQPGLRTVPQYYCFSTRPARFPAGVKRLFVEERKSLGGLRPRAGGARERFARSLIPIDITAGPISLSLTRLKSSRGGGESKFGSEIFFTPNDKNLVY